MATRDDGGLVLYVAGDGRDTWSGRLSAPDRGGTDGPFATLERARDEIRKIKETEGMPPGGVTVEIGGGSYLREQTFTLTERDSGSAEAPVVYRAGGPRWTTRRVPTSVSRTTWWTGLSGTISHPIL